MTGMTPNDALEALFVHLATATFDSVPIKIFWTFSKAAIGETDLFTQSLLWSWIKRDQRFQIGNKKFNQIESSLDFDSIESALDFFIRIHPDYQCIYLTSVLPKDNALGRMPYQLLRIIAHHGSSGINSINLIKESGQDPRSLTNRLQVLQDAQLITKMGVNAGRFNTNHMVHFRFMNNTVVIEDDGVYDRYIIMMHINKALKNGVRLTLDLFQEVKVFQPGVKLRWFNSILRFLVTTNYIEMVQVEHKERNRFYPGIRLLKDLPHANSKSELLEKIKEENGLKSVNDEILTTTTNDDDDDDDDDDPEINNALVDKNAPIVSANSTNNVNNQTKSENETDFNFTHDSTPQFNRFFPIVNQIRDLVYEKPSIISDVENTLVSTYKVRQIPNLVENIMSTDPIEGGSIIGQMIYSGKVKVYNLMSYKFWNENIATADKVLNLNDNIEEEIEKSNEVISLVELNAKYAKSFQFDRRFEIYSFPIDDSTGKSKKFLVWKVKKSNPWKSVVSRLSLVPKQIETEFIDLKIGKHVEVNRCDKDAYFETVNRAIALISKENIKNELNPSNIILEENNDAINNNNNDNTLINDYSSNKLKEKKINSSSEPTRSNSKQTATIEKDSKDTLDNFIKSDASCKLIDFGPARRRSAVLKSVDTSKCICICVEFCHKLSSQLSLDYIIDRRTLIRDATHLANEGKVIIDRLDGGKFIVKSKINPPNDSDIAMAVKDPPKKETVSRKFQDKIQWNGDLIVFDEKGLGVGLKSKSVNRKEERLHSAKGWIAQTGKRKKKAINYDHDKEDEDDYNIAGDSDEGSEDEEQDDDANNTHNNINKRRHADADDEDEDLVAPLMDSRRRKKFKPGSRQQIRVNRAFKKMRTSIRMADEHILLFIKAIVITQSLNTGNTIDWPKVASVFNDSYTSETLRRMWPRYKKILGYRNVSQAKKNWENVLMGAVESQIVSEVDLINYDMERMLGLWSSEGTEIFMSKSQFVICKNYEDNFKNHIFQPLKEEIGIEVFREPPSLIEKEQMWTHKSYTYAITPVDKDLQILKDSQNPTILQLAKTKLKALFATPPEKFQSSLVRELLQNISRETYARALTELEDQKAIAYLGEDSNIKFTLTDKALFSLDCKLTPTFLQASQRFQQIINELPKKSAILLSTRCPSGAYASILNGLAIGTINVIRVDQKPLELESYSTKSQDRSKLESDFLIKSVIDLPNSNTLAPLMGKPCQYLWIDLRGEFNQLLWQKCICVIIWCVAFHPGTGISNIVKRVSPLLEAYEVWDILQWLIKKGVFKGFNNGWWLTDTWYDVL
ncbi:transcription factor TFIIIC subunit [Martiniozyma asiatica (nom. inval.)]|nr:transcription factor TFIIIC subunit [Martiniozyma asiatica]